jgi:hypothetical protein
MDLVAPEILDLPDDVLVRHLVLSPGHGSKVFMLLLLDRALSFLDFRCLKRSCSNPSANLGVL